PLDDCVGGPFYLVFKPSELSAAVGYTTADKCPFRGLIVFGPAAIRDAGVAKVEAAQGSRPRRALRPHTLSTLLGLLASTGLRVGEALRLQSAHVHLDRDPPQLHILETKFRKSRVVPLHPSTAERLRLYQAQRARLHYDGLSDAFFVSERGQPIQHR